jgi:hypothetical protein
VGGFIASASGAVTGTAGFGSSLFLQRQSLVAPMTLTEMDLALGVSFLSTSNGAGTLSQSFVVYSLQGTTGLSSVLSTSGSFAWTTGTSTVAGSTSLTEFQGGWSVPKIHPLTFASSSLAAGEYVVGNLLNFAQASSTWTIGLYGALESFSQSTTISGITGISSHAANVQPVVLSSGASGLTAFNMTQTSSASSAHAASAISVAASNSVASVEFNISAANSAHNLISSIGTVQVGPLAPTLPSFVYIGTGSSTGASAAFPSFFVGGVMSTGAVPAAISLSTTALTYTGTAAAALPWMAMVGS